MGQPILKAVRPIEPEALLSEAEVIRLLGLQDRPNPRGALLWLIRIKRLRCVRIARGINSFRPADVQAFIDSNTG